MMLMVAVLIYINIYAIIHEQYIIYVLKLGKIVALAADMSAFAAIPLHSGLSVSAK